MTRKFRNIKGYGQLGSLGKSWLCFANSISLQLSESSMIYIILHALENISRFVIINNFKQLIKFRLF